MTTVLLTGTTAVLGRELKPRLLDVGHDLRATSRSPPTEGEVESVEPGLTDGKGIQESVGGVDIVVPAASNARGDSEAVDVAVPGGPSTPLPTRT